MTPFCEILIMTLRESKAIFYWLKICIGPKEREVSIGIFHRKSFASAISHPLLVDRTLSMNFISVIHLWPWCACRPHSFRRITVLRDVMRLAPQGHVWRLQKKRSQSANTRWNTMWFFQNKSSPHPGHPGFFIVDIVDTIFWHYWGNLEWHWTLDNWPTKKLT